MFYMFNYHILTSKPQPGQDALLKSIADKQTMQTQGSSQVSRFIISSRDLLRHFATVYESILGNYSVLIPCMNVIKSDSLKLSFFRTLKENPGSNLASS